MRKPLKCSFCNQKIEICHYCYKSLEKGKEIKCLYLDEDCIKSYHFCSKKCLYKWLRENTFPADVK